MASVDYREGRVRLFFRYRGKQYNRTVAAKNSREAEQMRSVVELTIQDLNRGRLAMPPDADVITFMLSGGKVADVPVVSKAFQTLQEVFDRYKAELTPGTKERSTLDTEGVHRKHLLEHLGNDVRLPAIQAYVDARAKEVGQKTIKMELATLRVIWKWAKKRGYVGEDLGWDLADLTLPKRAEKPPFQTWDQITRRLSRGGVTAAQVDALWECLWLDEPQTLEVLAWVQAKALYPFLYPMFCFAAFTGARRSEMIRSEREDWDFRHDLVAVREKKADTSKTFTTRQVTIHPTLRDTMKAWFKRSDGKWTICTSNHEPLGPRMASKYFRGAVAGGKWSVLNGWHVFRHSLASNLASSGVDQRVIDAVLGHHTEEMARRYRHLLPNKQVDALHALFSSPSS